MAKFSLSDTLKKLTGSAKTAAADIERHLLSCLYSLLDKQNNGCSVSKRACVQLA